MTGVDPFSVDWISSQIMGYRSSSVEFLKIAMKENLGNPNGIIARRENVEEFKKIFPKPNFTSSDYWWGIQFWLLKAYRRVVGDVVPPFLEES